MHSTDRSRLSFHRNQIQMSNSKKTTEFVVPRTDPILCLIDWNVAVQLLKAADEVVPSKSCALRGVQVGDYGKAGLVLLWENDNGEHTVMAEKADNEVVQVDLSTGAITLREDNGDLREFTLYTRRPFNVAEFVSNLDRAAVSS